MLSKSTVKYIQSLAHKKFRDEESVFIAEGPKIVEELLSEPGCILKNIYGLSSWILSNTELLKNNNIEDVVEISEVELKKISQFATPNKVVAIFEQSVPGPIPLLKGKLTLVLDDIQDPGNMGTIIRIADWYGIENIFCSMNSVDCYNSKVIQSSMGSIARVTIFYGDIIEFLKSQKSISVMASSLNGNSLQNIEKKKEGIIIIGNESSGISKEVISLANEQITIPRYGKAESLNAAVATAIILSHII